MPLTLRVALLVGTVLALAIVVLRVKKSRIRVADSLFWVVAAFAMVVLALFPQIASFFAGLIGYISPGDFVFLVVMALMLYKIYDLTCVVSKLTGKVEELSEELALTNKDSGK